MTALISVEQVHMRYPIPRRIRQYVLHPFSPAKRMDALVDIELQITEGERLALLGPNGAGKTSFLKLIGGLTLPTCGRILFRGLDVTTHHAELRRAVGLVMNEERSFYWRLTGRQNLEFFGTLDNMRGESLLQRIAEVSELVGIKPHLDKAVGSYSSGMRQRLAVARGLLSDPAVLLLDEPTRTLDPIGAAEQLDFMEKRLNNDLNKTLLIATHRLEEVARLCTRLVIFKAGRLVAEAKVGELLRAGTPLDAFYRSAIGVEPSRGEDHACA